MNELYRYIKIPNFELVQKELLLAIYHDYESHTAPHAFTYSRKYLENKSPTLMTWLNGRTKMPYRLLRYYITPPGKSLGAHIDGGGQFPTVPFGINIPVTGTQNTYHTFYQCNNSNIRSDIPENYLGGLHPKDYQSIQEIKKLEILQPCFTNNSVMHGVTNLSNKYRVMFTIRWALHPTIGRTIEEVIDTNGLFYD
jgi:hypothetical protein